MTLAKGRLEERLFMMINGDDPGDQWDYMGWHDICIYIYTYVYRGFSRFFHHLYTGAMVWDLWFYVYIWIISNYCDLVING